MAWVVWLVLVGIGALFLALLVGFVVWFVRAWRSSNGKFAFGTSVPSDQVLDGVRNYFIPKGWRVEESTRGFILLQQPTGAFTALVLLVVFLPLGLIYLLTGWAHGKLEVSVEPTHEEQSNVHLRWNDAALRQEVQRFALWLEGERAIA